MGKDAETNRIHIAMAGKDVENIISGVQVKGATELYLIISKEFEEISFQKIRERLTGIKVYKTIKTHSDIEPLENPIRSLVIDPFRDDAFVDMIGLIIDIIQSNAGKNAEFWINITGGTNLMSAAAEAGAVLTGAKAYYVVKGIGIETGKIVVLPWHSMNPRELDEKRLSILRVIDKLNTKAYEIEFRNVKQSVTQETKKKRIINSNEQIVEELGGISRKAIVHYLKELKESGYISRTEVGRETANELTAWGKIAIRLTTKGKTGK